VADGAQQHIVVSGPIIKAMRLLVELGLNSAQPFSSSASRVVKHGPKSATRRKEWDSAGKNADWVTANSKLAKLRVDIVG